MENYLGIEIDYNRDKTLPEKGLTMLTKKGFYKKSHETSPQQSFARAATCYCFGDYGLAQRIYDAVSKGWFMYASPVLSNANEVHWPNFSATQFNEASDWLVNNVIATTLPISCYLANVPDTKEGLVNSASEVRWLSMMGGGVGIYTSNRSPDDKSTGVMAHLRGYDADTLAYKQQESRRGSIAAYLDITHPEIKSFLSMRNPVGGDPNKKLFNLNNAVNLPDSFMESVINGAEYELVDPKHGKTGKTMSARDVWEEIIDMRFETGEPYIHWVDTVNSRLPKRITNPNYKVTQSNLCSEIELMTDASRTAVCCLSSLNLEKYEEWKDTTLVQDLIRFLDNVLEYFIRLAPKDKMARAIYSAKMERALGLGTFGWHSFLQSKNIPFESGGVNSAASWTHRLYSNILEKAESESKKMAIERGEAPDCTGSGFRNSHLLAVAPNASSSEILGSSPSIEPYAGNAFNSQGRAGSFLIKNKYLEKHLDSIGYNTDEVWLSIIENDGSVQHLSFLDDHTKKVFKIAYEIDPMWIIELASIRQDHICQSQSVNLFVPNDITKEEMSDIHMMAWKKKLKTLYYCRTKAAVKANIGTGGEMPLNAIPIRQKIEYDETVCRSCEG